MVSSAATTVDAYLDALPEPARTCMTRVRALVLAHLPEGYVEAMTWGMPTYEIPLARYPDTYNGKPLCYVAFAAQKRHNALYLNMAYAESGVENMLREAWAAAGRRLDMGKCCLRFRRYEDLLEAPLAEAIASMPVEAFIARYEQARAGTRAGH